MNFYTKVLAKFVAGSAVRVTVSIDVTSPTGLPLATVEETEVALRELKLEEKITKKS